jgi:uncharacterized protein (TIGR01777 family)
MNTHLLALQLMAAQGLLGAFDTLYHHELTEALPQRHTAFRELSIHAARAVIYSVLFIGLSAWEWHGAWALVLLAVFGVEIILTLWDFVVEDKTRLLPATERVTHTVLAINGGAFIALLALNTPLWFSQPTALAWAPHGWLSIFLALCGVGVGMSGVRDAFAARRLRKIRNSDKPAARIHFSDSSESVLITGATGFIGKHLVDALLADGQEVTVLTRNPKQAAWIFDGRVRCIQSMDELAPDVAIDVIINLAGARVLGWWWSSARKAVLRASRIEPTERLVKWIASAKRKPKLMLSASAIGFYGIQRVDDHTELTETSPPQPIFMSQLCQEWETAAQKASTYGVRAICMRFGMVLGHQGALPMMMLPIRLGFGGPLGTGRQWLSWIHIEDLLCGIAKLWQLHSAGDTELYDQYNFTAPEVVTQKQFSQIAAQVIHRPCFFPTPSYPIRLVLGKQADLLLEGQRVVPTRLLAHGFRFRYANVKMALTALI